MPVGFASLAKQVGALFLASACISSGETPMKINASGAYFAVWVILQSEYNGERSAVSFFVWALSDILGKDRENKISFLPWFVHIFRILPPKMADETLSR